MTRIQEETLRQYGIVIDREPESFKTLSEPLPRTETAGEYEVSDADYHGRFERFTPNV